ncbi:MAG: type VI secretion system-associated protein TagF [Cellvibrionaceae bacterium]
MTTNADTCGLFGKLPQQADFVSHFLPDSFTDHWHAWLQSSIGVSREQLGENWLDLYLTSPVWRFAIMPNIVTSEAIVGVIIPSVDEVGRYFPLTIAHLGKHQPWSAYLHGQSWYDDIEKIAVSALDDNMTYSHFMGSQESLPPPNFLPFPNYKTTAVGHSPNRAIAIKKPEDNTENELTNSLLNNLTSTILGQHSLWWTNGSDHVDPCLLMSSNLPDAGQFSAMLDGDWQKWGWAEEVVIKTEEALVE